MCLIHPDRGEGVLFRDSNERGYVVDHATHDMTVVLPTSIGFEYRVVDLYDPNLLRLKASDGWPPSVFWRYLQSLGYFKKPHVTLDLFTETAASDKPNAAAPAIRSVSEGQ